MRSTGDEQEQGSSPSQPTAPSGERSFSPGNKEDFERLYHLHYRAVMVTINAMLRNPAAAEDCAQSAFERAWRAWDSWEPSAPPGAWLHRIAINTATSYLRYEKLRQPAELLRRLRPQKDEGSDPYQNASPLMAALHRIPPRQAAALVLRHYHGYSNREIGAALGIPESTIASQLAAGKKRLRELLTKDPAFADEMENWGVPEPSAAPASPDTSERRGPADTGEPG